MLAMGLFTGCSSDHSFGDVYNYFNQLQVTVSDLGDEVKTTSTEYDYKTYKSSATSDFFKLQDNADGKQLTYMVDITYSLGAENDIAFNSIANNGTRLSGMSDSVYYGYYSIARLQETTLKYIYNYYNNWANNFYNGITKVADVQKSDSKLLYSKLEALHEGFTEFVTAKNNFEDLVATFGFESVHAFVQSSYCQSINNLIGNSLDFVECFKDLHIKYVYTKPYTVNDNASRVKDEMLLNVAKIIYFEDLRSFNYNNCDLTALAKDIVNATSIDRLSNDYASVLYQINKKSLADNNFAQFKDGFDSEEWLTDTELMRVVRAFNQKKDLYTQTYHDIDFYEYNYARTGYASTSVTADTYKSELTSQVRAKVNFLDDFYKYTFLDYAQYILQAVK